MLRFIAAVVLLCVWPTSAKPPPPKHVVVLMLENRAFDHMCGHLPQWGVNVDGVNETHMFNIANGTKYHPNAKARYVNPFDPYHGFPETTEELMGVGQPVVDPAPMSGFAELHYLHHKPDFWSVMDGFSPERVPAISTLAKDFAVMDRFYASLPGPTYPNRMFFHSGTSHGHLTDDLWTTLIPGVPQKTIYNVFNEQNVSWGVYYSDVSDTILFDQLRDLANLEKLHWFPEFKQHAKDGTLPQFSWVTPRFFPLFGAAQDQHPDHDVVLGEEFIAEVYEALRGGKHWNDTLFIVTYDEHGGFWDHVSPPAEGVPNPDGIDRSTFNFTRLGLRVCTVVASPRIGRGLVESEPSSAPQKRYEHQSTFQTVRHLWPDALLNPSTLLTKRTDFAASFDHLYSLDEPRTDCPTTLPTPKITPSQRKSVEAEQQKKTPNGLQVSFFKALQYRLKDAGLFDETLHSAVPTTQLKMGQMAHKMMNTILSQRKKDAVRGDDADF